MAIIKNPLTLIKGGTGTLIEKSITENGTYNAQDDNADGYSEVTVNVAGGGGDDFPFDSKRILKTEYNIGTGKTYMFSHYIVIGPNLNNNLYGDGTQVLLLDTNNNNEVLHSFSYENGYSSFIGLQFTAEGDWIFFTYQYTNSNYGYFTWIYHATSDTWSFYDNDNDHYIDRQGRMGSVSNVFKGKDFGTFISNYAPYCVQTDGTITRLNQGQYSVSVYLRNYTYGNYQYIGYELSSSNYNYYCYGYYKVVRANLLGEFQDIVSVYNGTSSSSYAYQAFCFGRFILLSGKGRYFTSTAIYDVEKIVAGQTSSIIGWSDSYQSVQNKLIFDENGYEILYVKNTYTHGIKLATYLQTGNTSDIINCTLPSGGSFTYVDAKIINGRFFIGTNIQVFELVGTGQTQVILTTNYNTSIQYCPKNTDFLAIRSASVSSGVIQKVYVYHTDTDTVSEYTNDAFHIASIVPYLPVKNDSYFTEKVEDIYIASYDRTCIIYNAYLDTYTLYRSKSTISSDVNIPYYCKINDEDFVLNETIAEDNYYHSCMTVINKNNTIRFSVTPTSSGETGGVSRPYVYNSKYYFQFYDSQATVKFYVLEYDKTNQTLTQRFSFASQIFNNNFMSNTGDYHSVQQGSLEIFPYSSAVNDGYSAHTNAQISSNYCLIFNKTNEQWYIIESVCRCYIWQDYSANLVVFRNTSNYLAIYHLDTNTIETTTVQIANDSSAKYVNNGIILAKGQTALVKYNLSNGTVTQVATSSNNSNSNNYGSIRVLDNIALVFTISGGWYNSGTDTFTSGVHSNTYSSNYYGSIRFYKLRGNNLMLHIGQGATSYSSYGTHQLIDKTNPIINLSTQPTNYGYSGLNIQGDLYIWSEWSNSTYYHIIKKYNDLTGETETKNIFIWRTSNVSYGDWFTTWADGSLILVIAGISSSSAGTVLYNVTRDKVLLGDLQSFSGWWLYTFSKGVGILYNSVKDGYIKLDYTNSSAVEGMLQNISHTSSTMSTYYLGKQGNKRVFLLLGEYTEADL